MNLTYKERKELNELSKQVFGTSSKWYKLVTDGFDELFTREREAMVPKADGKMIKKTFTDKKYVTKYYTVEEIRKVMVDALAARAASEASVAQAEAAQTTPTEEQPTA